MAKKTQKGKASLADQIIHEALKAVEKKERREKTSKSSSAAQQSENLDDEPTTIDFLDHVLLEPTEAQGLPEISVDGDEFEEDLKAEEIVEKPNEQHRISKPVDKNRNSSIQIDLKKYIDRESHLRLMAEFENYRKRSIKDKEVAELAGREKTLRGFLDILDNFERGLSQSTEDHSPLAMGMRMIFSQAEGWLKSEGLERILSVGEVFDPRYHEAVSQLESNDVPTGVIIAEVRRGYRWADRLLRPAGVVVSKGKSFSVVSDREGAGHE